MATAPPSYNDVTKADYGIPNQNYQYQQTTDPQEPVYPTHPNYLNQQQQPNEGGGDCYSSDVFTSFSDKSVRRAFIRKVYLILTAQLLITCLFISIFQFVRPINLWVKHNAWFYYLSYAVFLVTYIALVCCPSVRRKYPGNFIALLIFTLAFSYMTATIATFYDTPAVIAAAGITAIVCLSISIFAIQTKVDFTMCSGLILVVSLVFILTGLTCAILYWTNPHAGKVLHGVYAGIGILLFGIYLVYDTQLVIGGRKYELSPEDYIEGALQLYLDVVQMFLMILSLFGDKN